ncbi:MAG: putative sulfate exporter family transporter [Meiothermus sp.]
MTRPAALKFLPGLVLVLPPVVLAFLLASLPGLKAVGPLGLALLVGLMLRLAYTPPTAVRPGLDFAAKSLLRLGVVFLGVRLNLGLLLQAGPLILVLDLGVIALALLLVNAVGKAMGMPRGLRLSLALGTGICGASAIAAGASVVRAKEEHVSLAVAVVSLMGTLGALGLTLIAPWFHSQAMLGLLAGATLHEVAQVLAVGVALGPSALDLATLTKLTRVALLAPTLLLLGVILARREGHLGDPQGRRPPLLPPFLLGFIALGGLASLGLIPPELKGSLQTASQVLTATSMAAIGLGVDLRSLRGHGLPAAWVGFVGFAFLLLAAGLVLALRLGHP